jgi:hypothetical protein
MNWREVVKFLLGFMPMRVWCVEFKGARIGWGPKEDALADYNDLRGQGEGSAKLYPIWKTRREFYSLDESSGR